MDETIINIIIIAVFIYAVISGFIKGLLSQVGQIVGLIIGVLASRTLSPSVVHMLGVDANEADSISPVSTVLCYILIFIVAYFAVVLTAKMLKIVVKAACLGVLDRIGGAIFKLLKWAIILSLIYNLVVVCAPSLDPHSGGTALERFVFGIAPKVLGMF